MTRVPALVLLAALLIAGGCSSARGTATAGFSIPAPDFTLTDQTDAPWTLSQQRGKTLVLFFGYTHCGDTCPTTTAKLAQALRDVHARATDAQLVFLSIDPARDTPAALTRYIRRFPGAPIVGLTGTPAQIARIVREYHIFVKRTPPEKPGNGYDFMHTALFYLIDRDGRERAVHDDDERVAQIASDLRRVMR